MTDARKFRAEMVNQGLTVTRAAKLIGISRQHLSAAINGRSPMTKRVARDIARETTIPADLVREAVVA